MRNREGLTDFISFMVAAVVVLTAMTGCERRPADVLSEKETVSLMADLQLAEAYLRVNPSGSINEADRKAIADGVLREHGVSRHQYDATMAYYGHNFDKYVELYDKAGQQIRKKERHYQKDGNSSSERDASSGLWPYGKNALLSSMSPRSGLVFSVDPGRFEKGETLEWSFRMHKSDMVNVVLGVVYDNGLSDYVTQSSQGDRRVVVKLPTDSAYKVKRIFGTLRPQTTGIFPLWLDSISLIHRVAEDYDRSTQGMLRRYMPPTGRRRRPARTDSAAGAERRAIPVADPRAMQNENVGVSTVATGTM